MAEDRSPRRRPEPKQQRPRRHVAAWLRRLLLVIPVLVVAGLTYAVLQSPYLQVQHIKVVGAETLDTHDLADASGLYGKNMLRLPLHEASQRVLSLPQVKSVAWERNWPDGLTLRITEREPVAIWTVGGKDYSVAEDGTVLGDNTPSGPAPHIIEPDSTRVMGLGDQVHPDAIALAERIYQESPKVLNQPVDRLEYRADVGVTAVFANGMRVTFGDARAYDYKVAVLTSLLDKLSSAKQRAPRDVDLRFGERVTYD